MPQIIDSFEGKYRFLSNFFPSQVYMDGLLFYTVEAAYQAAKTPIESKRRIMSKMPASLAKKYAHHLPRPADWDARKEAVMLDLVMQKFMRPDNHYLAKKLIDTGDATLIEGNTWGDTYWGQCDGVGLNRLGSMLMQVRDRIAGDLNIKLRRT